ncbi:MAG: hypothetical protein LBG71_03250 [Clostridiales Family XIII bacterium]|nr:hypothetical protein [Clostridiales Family XIII bacterium]
MMAKPWVRYICLVAVLLVTGLGYTGVARHFESLKSKTLEDRPPVHNHYRATQDALEAKYGEKFRMSKDRILPWVPQGTFYKTWPTGRRDMEFGVLSICEEEPETKKHKEGTLSFSDNYCGVLAREECCALIESAVREVLPECKVNLKIHLGVSTFERLCPGQMPGDRTLEHVLGLVPPMYSIRVAVVIRNDGEASEAYEGTLALLEEKVRAATGARVEEFELYVAPEEVYDDYGDERVFWRSDRSDDDWRRYRYGDAIHIGDLIEQAGKDGFMYFLGSGLEEEADDDERE